MGAILRESSSPLEELKVAKRELARARMERDHALRLLRQQLNLTTTKIRDESFAFRMEQDGFGVRLLRRIPPNVKRRVPLGLKQFARNIIVKFG